MNISERFYNFYRGEKNQGYYYVKQTDDSLFSQAKFMLEDSELFTNTFHLKIDQGRVVSYKYRDDDWVDFRSHPADHYPTSAYPLLLSRAVIEPYTYIAIYEGEGSVLGETTLTADGDDIIETRDAQVKRRFMMRDGVPVMINWGGPISHLCQDAKEAVNGSEVAFDS